MNNNRCIYQVISFAEEADGIADKKKLEKNFQEKFSLSEDHPVYYCDDFAIRFSKAKAKKPSNTILSLSKLQKYDDRPFFVCGVTSTKNYLYLANTTFLSKISHSSQQLEVDKIRGSFNGTDIVSDFDGIPNVPEHFSELYTIHKSIPFEDNLTRLVEATNNIVGKKDKFIPNESQLAVLKKAPKRAIEFINSEDYKKLENDLIHRANGVKSEIFSASKSENVNLRGRIIEYLIAPEEERVKEEIVDALQTNKTLPNFETKNDLGDYYCTFDEFEIAVDIKSKMSFLNSNPKAYNIDKLLKFLSQEKSVFMIFLIEVDDVGNLSTRLCSVFQKNLIDGTRRQNHWAGRNSRGVMQFNGKVLSEILKSTDVEIDENKACLFLDNLLSSNKD